jgi:hypothetical protein
MNIFLKSLLTASAITLAGYLFLTELNRKKKIYNQSNISLLLKPAGEKGFLVDGKDIRNELFEKLNRKADRISTDYSVSFSDGEKIRIVLKGVTDTIGITSFFTGQNALEIWELYNLNEIAAGYSVADRIIRQQEVANKGSADLQEVNPGDSDLLSKTPDAKYSGSENDKSGLYKYLDLRFNSQYNFQILGAIKPQDSSFIFPVFRHPDVRAVLPADAKLVLGKSDPNLYKNLRPLYAIKTYNQPNRPFISDKDINEAQQDFNPYNGKPIITFQLKPYASKIWEDLTRRNTNRGIAIMIDGIIISAPTVTGVITGGNVEISGDFTVPQARALAAGLGSGRLPVKLYLESYQINKARVVTVSQKMLMLLIICFVLSGAISYFLFSLPKPLVNK